MERELIINSNQVYIGDNSTLTLNINPEANEQLTNLLNGKCLYLIFDNLTNDLTDDSENFVSFSFECIITVANGKEMLSLMPAPQAPRDLFRSITWNNKKIFLKDAQNISISWDIKIWDTPGTYTIGGFIGVKDQSLNSSNWMQVSVSRDPKNIDFSPPIKLRVVEEAKNEPLKVSLYEAKREQTSDQPLWSLIRNRTVDFSQYRAFIDRVLCSTDDSDARAYAMQRHLPFNRAASYSMLKHATEFYLMQEVGLAIVNDTDPAVEPQQTTQLVTPIVQREPASQLARQLQIRERQRSKTNNVNDIRRQGGV
ncbi:MAG TPA: hypothetical protein VF690_10220, partial [Hymenobacter sp.]